ncbi:MAG TPA: adenylyl-sulfate kinase [Bryobacteraceae bacterium]|nr:adenylyl-sulfate kinase [Bryobacteraceae bacterium]
MEHKEAFAVWITGLPASGKSTVAAALKAQLAARGVDAAALESDQLRTIFTVHPRYDEEERDQFYAQMAWIGELLVRHGVPVIFDATANRRVYRDRVRQKIARFVEVFVDVPLETCVARDPKGIYRSARAGGSATVPGLQAAYEPPEAPEVVVHGEAPEVSAQLIIAKLAEKGYV